MMERTMPEENDLNNQAMSVSEFVRITDKCLKELGVAKVAGEISELKAYRHLYFTLKDEESSVDCLMWNGVMSKLPFTPEVGMQVVVSGQSSLYQKNGSFKLIVSRMEQAGRGLIMERLARLKEKLQREGVFDLCNRELPPFPRLVGVITSKEGEAIHDIITTAQTRFPGLEIRIYPAKVQGSEAPASLVEALDLAYEENVCDVLIIGRGGGSFDDLLCFSDEAVARKVASSPIPIISAVGHEPDVALTDFAADVRAATPTRAAELVTPVTRDDLMDVIAGCMQRLDNAEDRILDSTSIRFDSLRARLESGGPSGMTQRLEERLGALISRLELSQSGILSAQSHKLALLRARLGELDPQRRLLETSARLKELTARAQEVCDRSLLDAKERIYAASHALMTGRASEILPETRSKVMSAIGRLDALSPLKVLTRGYSVTLDAHGKAVSRAGVSPGDELTTMVADGTIISKVERTLDKTADPFVNKNS